MKKILSVFLVVLLSACASKTTKPGGEGGNTGTGAMSGENASGGPTGNPLTDPNNILSKRSVYFWF